MMIADVAGHGEAVASTSSVVKRIMKRYMNWPDQRSVLRRLNRDLAQLGFSALTTAAVVSYYPPRRWLSVSYAGHHPAWLYHGQEDTWKRLEITRTPGQPLEDLPLAADPDTLYTRSSRRVQLGDRLLLVTDGVLEAPDSTGRFFGTKGVERVLGELRREPMPRIATGLLDAIRAHCGSEALSHDDVTFALLEFVEGPKGSTLRHAIINRILRPRGNSAELRAGLAARR